MDVLVLSACSGNKQYDSVIECETLDTHPHDSLIREYAEPVAPAAEMYTGGEHGDVRDAVSQLREVATVEWCIISAGFGLLRSDTQIPSYDCTFSDTESVRERVERFGYDSDELTITESVRAVGRELGIPRDIRTQLDKPYDLLLVVLGEKYLQSADDAFSEIPDATTALAFAASGNRHLIGDCEWIPATEDERETLGTTHMRLRGKQMLIFASNVRHEQELRHITDDPSATHELSIQIGRE